MKIAVIDGQGGGIGKNITEKLRASLPEETYIIALGTNALATSLMLKAGANEGASGENAIIYNADRVDLIAGTMGIIVPHGMQGELTPAMAEAISKSRAEKILLPLMKSEITFIGLPAEPLPHLVEKLVEKVKEKIKTQ